MASQEGFEFFFEGQSLRFGEFAKRFAAAALREGAAAQPRAAFATPQVHEVAALGAGDVGEDRWRCRKLEVALAIQVQNERRRFGGFALCGFLALCFDGSRLVLNEEIAKLSCPLDHRDAGWGEHVNLLGQ